MYAIRSYYDEGLELLVGLLDVLGIGLVAGVAEQAQGQAEDLAGVVGHQQLALERRIPQVGDGLDLDAVRQFRVHRDGGGAPHVGQGVGVALVKGLVQEPGREVGEIGQQGLVEREQQVLLSYNFV